MATKTDAPEALSASALWASDSPDDWRAALDAYAQRRDALNHEKLTRLDEWFFHRLTVDVRARTPPCMTAKELVDMVDWKMTRGKVRPNLLNFAKAHSEATVKDATRDAIARLRSASRTEDIPRALEPAVKLKGIGPATASAVLACADDSVPFMCDDLILVALGKMDSKFRYNESNFIELCEAARRKGRKVGMTASEVERAIFSAACLDKKPKTTSAAGGSKRKR